MYFRTFDPYDDKYDVFSRDIKKKENIITDNIECIICLTQSTELNQVYHLDFIDFINKSCECNTCIHEACLRTWIKNNSSCPICRNKLQILDMTIVELGEDFMHISYNFLNEYKQMVCIIFIYLLFLQIAFFYMIFIHQKTQYETQFII